MIKKLIATMMLAVVPMAAWCQKSTLNATLRGIGPEVRVVVSNPIDGRLVPADTLIPDNKGQFKIERQTNGEPQFFVLSLTTEHSPLVHFMLMPKEKVTVEMEYHQNTNSVDMVRTKGSDNMKLYATYNRLATRAYHNKEAQAAMADSMEALIAANTNVLMSAFLVTYFESAFDQYAPLYKAVADGLSKDYPNDVFVKHVADKVRGYITVGMVAPEISMKDRDGNVRRLSDLRGKVVLIDFWASWCRPCRAENPNVVRLYHKYHDRGFEIFSVSLDNSRDKWLQAIEQDGLVWENHVSDLMGWTSSGGRAYGISSIPATVLLDKEGRVLARNLRGIELENKLKEIFGE